MDLLHDGWARRRIDEDHALGNAASRDLELSQKLAALFAFSTQMHVGAGTQRRKDSHITGRGYFRQMIVVIAQAGVFPLSQPRLDECTHVWRIINTPKPCDVRLLRRGVMAVAGCARASRGVHAQTQSFLQ